MSPSLAISCSLFSALTLVVTSFGLGYLAIARRHDWSFVLTTIFAVVADRGALRCADRARPLLRLAASQGPL